MSAVFLDTIDWGVTYEFDVLIEDVAPDGTKTPKSLTSFTDLVATVKLSNEAEAELFAPVVTNPSTGVIRCHISPAQAKLLPRVGINSLPPQVVAEIRATTSDGLDAIRPVRCVLTVDVGPLT